MPARNCPQFVGRFVVVIAAGSVVVVVVVVEAVAVVAVVAVVVVRGRGRGLAVAVAVSFSVACNKQQLIYRVCVSLSASLLNVDLRSEGCDDPEKTGGCGVAFIKVNNQDYSLHKRGFNVAVFTEEGM